MNQLPQGPSKKLTARRHLVEELTAEILKQSASEDFAIASEHQLCRRFAVSRVTVRLALGDLENQGFIYRRHGKGTFAHGHSKRARSNVGILMKSSDALMHAPIVEIIRGAQAAMTSLNSSLVLISISPLEWRADPSRNLAGIIVLPQAISPEELEYLKNRNLPYMCIQESQLMDGEIDCFCLGQQLAEALTSPPPPNR